MDVHAERRVLADRRRPAGEPQLSEETRIEAAQFLLGTRQREEAALRATHLRDPSPDDEEHARETLAQMIHLQEVIMARSAEAAARRGRKRNASEIDLRSDAARTTSTFPSAFIWVLVGTLLVAVALAVGWQLQLF